MNPPKVIIRVTLMDGFGLAGLAIFGTLGYEVVTDSYVSLSKTAILAGIGFALGCLVGLTKALTREYQAAPPAPAPPILPRFPEKQVTPRARRVKLLGNLGGLLATLLVIGVVVWAGVIVSESFDISPDSTIFGLVGGLAAFGGSIYAWITVYEAIEKRLDGAAKR